MHQVGLPNVQRKTDESAADRQIRTIGRLGGDRVKLLGDTEGRSILARVEAIGIESEYRSQPVPGVVEVGLAAVAARRHTRRVAGQPTTADLLHRQRQVCRGITEGWAFDISRPHCQNASLR